MYTATMIYPVKQEFMNDFIHLWKEKIMNLAMRQPGCIRMQLLTRKNEAMAIGTWEEKVNAENFMAQDPFKALMSAVRHMLEGDPRPKIWNLSIFSGH